MKDCGQAITTAAAAQDTKIVMTKITIDRALGVVNALDPVQDLVSMIIIAESEEIEVLRTAVVMTTDVAMRTTDAKDLVTTNEATVKETVTMTEIMTDIMKTGIVRETEKGAGTDIETAVVNVVVTVVANVVENETEIATDTAIVKGAVTTTKRYATPLSVATVREATAAGFRTLGQAQANSPQSLHPPRCVLRAWLLRRRRGRSRP